MAMGHGRMVAIPAGAAIKVGRLGDGEAVLPEAMARLLAAVRGLAAMSIAAATATREAMEEVVVVVEPALATAAPSGATSPATG